MAGIVLPCGDPAFVCCTAVAWALEHIPGAKYAYETMSDDDLGQIFPEWTP